MRSFNLFANQDAWMWGCDRQLKKRQLWCAIVSGARQPSRPESYPMTFVTTSRVSSGASQQASKLALLAKLFQTTGKTAESGKTGNKGETAPPPSLFQAQQLMFSQASAMGGSPPVSAMSICCSPSRTLHSNAARCRKALGDMLDPHCGIGADWSNSC